MLLALIIMATITIGLLFSGWLTPAPIKADTSDPDPDPGVETTNCVTASITTNCTEATVTLSNVPPIIVCLGSSASASTLAVVTNGVQIIDTGYTNAGNSGDDKCPDTYQTNSLTPTLLTNWWTASGCGLGTNANGPGLSTSGLNPTNDGQITVTFYQKWKHTCDTNTDIASIQGTVYVAQVTLDADGSSADVESADVHPSDTCSCGLGDATIWWFNGESPDGYKVSTIATVTGAPSDATLDWSIESGEPATITGSGSSVTIKGTGPSAEHGVTIDLTINGTKMCPQFLTVKVPNKLTPLTPEYADYRVTYLGQDAGYLSVMQCQIVDQFNAVLPSPVPFAEDINGDGLPSKSDKVTQDRISDFTLQNGYNANEDWIWGDEAIDPKADPNRVTDNIGSARPSGEWTPNPKVPQNPLSMTPIAHSSPNGGFFVGGSDIGKGVKVRTLSWHRYIDHGRHISQ